MYFSKEKSRVHGLKAIIPLTRIPVIISPVMRAASVLLVLGFVLSGKYFIFRIWKTLFMLRWVSDSHDNLPRAAVV